VFSYATKVLMALTGSAFVGAAVYYGVVGEKSGALLMVFVGLAALLALLTVVASGVLDIAPQVPADAPAPERRATTPGEPARGSVWPLLTAAAAAILAVGAATETPVVVAGAVALFLCGLGWFGRSWADHHTFTEPVRRRVSDRFLAPLGSPVLGFALVALIAISLSRVFLAVSLEVAPWIALAVAVLILLGCAWVASRPRMGQSALMALAALAGVSTVGAGIAGATQGEREFHPHHTEEPIEVVAHNVQFEEKELTAPAGKEVTITFHNEDAGIYHNVAVYEGDAAEAPPIFNGAGFPGVATHTYKFTTPKQAGNYSFRCDFHANMVGTLVVEGG
jgi:plastocyanin